MQIIDKLLPHFNERPLGTSVDTIIIHSLYADSQPDPLDPIKCWEALDRHQVSPHYMIAQNGEIWRLVPEGMRAWHAGASKLPFRDDNREAVNNFSIGIELIGSDLSGFSARQYSELACLVAELLVRHPIRIILGHEHVSPGRKIDPGPTFDWGRFRSLLDQSVPKVLAEKLRFPKNPSSRA